MDVHVHIYPTGAQGKREKDRYSIVEYGSKAGVQFSDAQGSVDEAQRAIKDAEVARAVVLNVFWTRQGEAGLIEECPGTPQAESVEHTLGSAKASLTAYNQWVCDLARDHQPLLVPFISVDPWVFSPEQARRHVYEMAARHGARGVKIHPPVQRFHASDDRLWPVYEACAELRLPILAHSGYRQRRETLS